MQALEFLLKTIGGLLIMACVLRAYMHWVGLGVRDPIGQFVVAITDWLVKPLRKIMPTIRRFDWASLLAGLLVALVVTTVVPLLYGAMPNPGLVLLAAIFYLIKESMFLLIILVIAGAVLSWVNPNAPIQPTLSALTNPLLAPIRKVIPLIGGIDLSPMVLIIGLMFIQQLVSGLF